MDSGLEHRRVVYGLNQYERYPVHTRNAPDRKNEEAMVAKIVVCVMMCREISASVSQYRCQSKNAKPPSRPKTWNFSKALKFLLNVRPTVS